MKIVLDDKIPYIDGALEQLRGALEERGTKLEIVRRRGSEIDRETVHDADILLVRTRTRCDATLLAGSHVSLVVTATIGYDHLDTDFLNAEGIEWTNCPGCNATSVAQYVGSCLLLLERERGLTLKDATLGIVGIGHVGQAVAEAAKRLGIGRTLLNDPPREESSDANGIHWSSLETVLAESDVITLHTPLTAGGRYPTLHLLDTAAFEAMRRRPVIINAARGGVVDEGALEAALEAGQVSAAIIDTWEGEPEIRRTLLDKAYIATPHIAGYSADGKANATRMTMEAVCRHLGISLDLDIRPPRLTMKAEEDITADIPADAKELALWLYDPSHDSRRLKSAPQDFELQRGNYPLRRELPEVS